jgi:hypothetical protein
MSGGSYEYLCFKDASDLANYEHQLQSMADRLAGLGYAEDAARETTEVLLMHRQAMVRIDTRLKRLSDIWHAVEWWDSCDSGEDGVKKALAEYRGETP